MEAVSAGTTTASRGVDEAAAAEWVGAFERAWRAPIDADRFADAFLPSMHPAIRLVQPQVPTVVGHEAFRERFARPLFALMPDLHGTVEGWAQRGDTVYIELRLDGTVGRWAVTVHTCDRITLGADGRATERVAHLDPTPVLWAVILTPRAWPALIRRRLAARRRSA